MEPLLIPGRTRAHSDYNKHQSKTTTLNIYNQHLAQYHGFLFSSGLNGKYFLHKDAKLVLVVILE